MEIEVVDRDPEGDGIFQLYEVCRRDRDRPLCKALHP
jgi:hypothetical protein